MSVTFTTPEAVGAAIATVMAGISGMQKVDRQYAEDLNNYEYPSCYINDVRRDRVRVLKDVVRITHTFDIVVFDRDEENENLVTTLNSLINSSTSALLNDPTLGGTVYNLRIIRVETDEGFYSPICVAGILIEVYYLARN